jgi:hypothetical protein
VNAVKKWPWNKILICVGWLLVVAGVAPGAYLLVRLGNAHNQKLLSVPVSLKQGAFTSPNFTAGPDGDYLIGLRWDPIPARQTSVDLDWKIVADNGSVVEHGSFNNLLRGANAVTLGSYKPISGQREQIVLDGDRAAGYVVGIFRGITLRRGMGGVCGWARHDSADCAGDFGGEAAEGFGGWGLRESSYFSK